MIFSNSLSALQVLEKLNSNHPLLIQIHDMLHKIEVDQNPSSPDTGRRARQMRRVRFAKSFFSTSYIGK